MARLPHYQIFSFFAKILIKSGGKLAAPPFLTDDKQCCKSVYRKTSLQSCSTLIGMGVGGTPIMCQKFDFKYIYVIIFQTPINGNKIS